VNVRQRLTEIAHVEPFSASRALHEVIGPGLRGRHHADARTSFVDIAILRFLLFAFVKAFQDRRAPWYQRGLIRKPLRKIGVILLHDVERRFLGELAMVLGK
jgi:hypothetical protein